MITDALALLTAGIAGWLMRDIYIQWKFKRLLEQMKQRQFGQDYKDHGQS